MLFLEETTAVSQTMPAHLECGGSTPLFSLLRVQTSAGKTPTKGSLDRYSQEAWSQRRATLWRQSQISHPHSEKSGVEPPHSKSGSSHPAPSASDRP
jgi:hypothetical protein